MKTKPLSIENFILEFKKYEEQNVLVKTFTGGFCYYFSVILKEKFPRGDIFYSIENNHFLFLLNGNLYDINGNVTDDYNVNRVVSWCAWTDDIIHKQRIVRDCIEKESPNE